MRRIRAYSPGQVAGAAFLGAPIAGSILLASNFQLFGRPEARRQALVWGAASTAAVLVAAYLLPDSFPVGALPLVYVFALHQIARRTQASQFDACIANGGSRHSHWRVAAIGLSCLVAVLLLAGALLFAIQPSQDEEALRAQRLADFSHARPDAFTWTVLEAESNVDDAQQRGAIGETDFLQELERYPWKEQLTTAESLRRSSPTLTLYHGGHDRYLAISGIRHSAGDAFFLFWGQGSTGDDPRLLPVDEMPQVARITELFFAGEIARLDDLFATYGQPAEKAFAGDISVPALPDLSSGP